MTEDRHILRCTVPDGIGRLAGVTGFIAERNLSIVESHDYADPESETFFIRAEIASGAGAFDEAGFKAEFAILANGLNMDWSLMRASHKLSLIHI